MFTIKQRNWSIICFLCDYQCSYSLHFVSSTEEGGIFVDPSRGSGVFDHFYFAIMITFVTTRETSCFGRPWDGMRRVAGGGERQLGGEAANREKNICISLGRVSLGRVAGGKRAC